MFDEVAGESPADVQAAYAERLQAAIDEVGGVAAATRESDVDEATVRAIQEGRVETVTLDDAAAIGALAVPGDAETVLAEARDALLLGMANAVMDVDTLARALDADLDPREVQQKIEGRFPLTLGEYARIQIAIRRHGE